MKNILKKIWKWIKIISFILLSILSTVLSIILIFVFRKDKNLNDNTYYKKMNELLKEKQRNEENIADSTIDDYDDHGISKPRKRKRK